MLLFDKVLSGAIPPVSQVGNRKTIDRGIKAQKLPTAAEPRYDLNITQILSICRALVHVQLVKSRSEYANLKRTKDARGLLGYL